MLFAASYNPRWSFHYNPETVNFFDVAIEVCDATLPYVEENLDEAGGAFLPGAIWCPWSSRLTREIKAP
ncbi:BP74-related protein [Streptomyces sp. NPDC004100]